MSYALTAIILIRLDARRGGWVSVLELASHLGMSAQAVRDELERLVPAQHELRVHRNADGAIESAMVPDEEEVACNAQS